MKLLRSSLRYIFSNYTFKGRHRLSDKLGLMLAPKDVEIIKLNDVYFPVDHQVEFYRYMYYGVYEERFVSHLKKVVREGDIIIEPGVNVGYVTAVLQGLVGDTGKIYGLEPSMTCYNKITSYLNCSNIVLMNMALSSQDGTAYFVDTPRVISRGYSFLSEVGTKNEEDNEYLIETITVDTLCKKNNIEKVRYLKLDVEGAELISLKGATGMLAKKKIDYILVETCFYDTHKNMNMEMATLLTGCGYKPYFLTEDKLQPIDFYSISGIWQDVIWTHIDND
jgi:FkbM family methyltransferase